MAINKFFKQFISLQFLKFGIVGFFNTLIGQSTTYGIIFIFKILKEEVLLIFLASFVGNTVGIFNSFYWNNRYVFKNENNKLLTFFKTFSCYTATWFLSNFLTFIYSNLIGINKLLIPALSMAITVPVNFLINKFWAFK